MRERNDIAVLEMEGWIVRFKPPAFATSNSKVMLLIHGLRGNENVMWIFAQNLPKNYWILSPRAPIPDGQGFAWVNSSIDLPNLLDFGPQANALIKNYDLWIKNIGAPDISFDAMGFSQGAAMGYALAAFYPQSVDKIIALAGYLPEEENSPGRYAVLRGKRVFVAHGTKDEVIPITRADEDVQTLRTLGADVNYCQSDTGHKMNPSCLKGLEGFLLS